MKNKALRLEKILDLLTAEPGIRVSDISERLETSEVTIRKDLTALEAEGKIIRSHGSARLAKKTQREHHTSDKIAISQAAEKIIKDGDIITISTGSTCMHVCDAFQRKSGLLILTNSFEILDKILPYENVTAFFLGGKVNQQMRITTGNDLGEQLKKYTADKLFLGMDGVDPEQGATTYNHVEKDIMRELMQQAKQRILVADGSKIGKVTFAKIADVNEFDTLITNSTPENEQLLRQIEGMGVEVIRA